MRSHPFLFLFVILIPQKLHPKFDNIFHRLYLCALYNDKAKDKKMREKTFTLMILHIAVFLAGWTGIFGRLISLGGLPLVWYRMITSVVVLAAVLGCMRRLHRTGWKAKYGRYLSIKSIATIN